MYFREFMYTVLGEDIQHQHKGESKLIKTFKYLNAHCLDIFVFHLNSRFKATSMHTEFKNIFIGYLSNL